MRSEVPVTTANLIVLRRLLLTVEVDVIGRRGRRRSIEDGCAACARLERKEGTQVVGSCEFFGREAMTGRNHVLCEFAAD